MPLPFGEPAPWFKGPTPTTPEFVFDTAAGRYVLLLFLPLESQTRFNALQLLAANQMLFDDRRACAFVIVRDPETQGLKDMRGLRWILDRDFAVSRQFDAEDAHWLLLDPTLRCLKTAPISEGEALMREIAALPAPADHAGPSGHAPVLVVPRVFEPGFCRELIDLHAARGADMTGVMRDAGDRTVYVMDDLKKRRDIFLRDPAEQAPLRERLEARLFPMIQRGLGFAVTEIERYVISCYDADEGGVFHPHRDNTTFGTAHRKFACSLNLNDDFDGGDVRFPEFGPQTFRAPVGGAVIFSCALMHEATKVTRGRRYAFLPFFYDAEGAATLAAYQARTARPEAS
jgi:hypothetical protein